MLLLVVISAFSVSLAADVSHLVRDLPGQPPVSFKHYAGRIPVDTLGDRSLFYWFFEAAHSNASSLPVVLWLNGGPGCSSVGAGALKELGPFFVTKELTLTLNPYSWNTVANIIFLETPAGVGFSQSKDFGPFSDDQTASENLSFLIEWLRLFPEYKTNELYITGESYAGHYIPTLALKLLAKPDINFKGLAIGNPLTAVECEALGKLHFFYSHSIIPEELYKKALQSCHHIVHSTECANAQRRITQNTAEINRYNVYNQECSICQKNTATYLNLNLVQAALNLGQPNMTWINCNAPLKSKYSSADRNASMIPLYKQLFRSHIRIWIFSGDFDSVVPTLSTQAWINDLNLSVEKPWYTWSYGKQVGGWSQVFSGLTFVTVRGAGHKAAIDKPGPSLEIFKSFLQSKPLPNF